MPIQKAHTGYLALDAAVKHASSSNLIVSVAGMELAEFVQNWLCSLRRSVWAGVATIIVVALSPGLCSAIAHLTVDCKWCSCVTIPSATQSQQGSAVALTVVWGEGTSHTSFEKKLEVACHLLGLRAAEKFRWIAFSDVDVVIRSDPFVFLDEYIRQARGPRGTDGGRLLEGWVFRLEVAPQFWLLRTSSEQSQQGVAQPLARPLPHWSFVRPWRPGCDAGSCR